jgi:hypothetical protein
MTMHTTPIDSPAARERREAGAFIDNARATPSRFVSGAVAVAFVGEPFPLSATVQVGRAPEFSNAEVRELPRSIVVGLIPDRPGRYLLRRGSDEAAMSVFAFHPTAIDLVSVDALHAMARTDGFAKALESTTHESPLPAGSLPKPSPVVNRKTK